MVGQIVHRDVSSVIDVAKYADVARVQHIAKGVDDSLDARVIGSDSVTDQTVWRGQPIEQVDAHIKRTLVFEKNVGCVNSRRPGAHDGKAKCRHYALLSITRVANRTRAFLGRPSGSKASPSTASVAH